MCPTSCFIRSGRTSSPNRSRRRSAMPSTAGCRSSEVTSRRRTFSGSRRNAQSLRPSAVLATSLKRPGSYVGLATAEPPCHQDQSSLPPIVGPVKSGVLKSRDALRARAAVDLLLSRHRWDGAQSEHCRRRLAVFAYPALAPRTGGSRCHHADRENPLVPEAASCPVGQANEDR